MFDKIFGCLTRFFFSYINYILNNRFFFIHILCQICLKNAKKKIASREPGGATVCGLFDTRLDSLDSLQNSAEGGERSVVLIGTECLSTKCPDSLCLP